MSEPFKFVHGSDFRLDEAMRDFAAIPAHLRTVVADAPYAAATRLFDLALTEGVDFVLLSGNLLDSELGSCRPAAFLLSQFNRLRDKGIEVYWCGGQSDQPDRWPAGVELPDNVCRFASPVVEERVHSRRGKPLATIFGAAHDSRRSGSGDFSAEASAVFPVVLTCGSLDSQSLLARNIRYWAIGGSPQPALVERQGAWIGRAGSPQSRCLAEPGSHGCLLVRVDAQGVCRPQQIELDGVRWLPQQISIAENATDEDVRNVLGERALKLISDQPDRLLLASWRIETAGAFNPAFRSAENTESWLKWLRDEFGRAADGLWSTALTIAPPESLPAAWYEEDTILGDFLRATGRYQSDETLSLALHEWLPASADSAATAQLVRLVGERRKEVLAAAATLGACALGEGRQADAADQAA